MSIVSKKEQELFEKKLEVLQRELRQLAYDRQKLEREKAIFKELKGRLLYIGFKISSQNNIAF